jgi:hypothetical protein
MIRTGCACITVLLLSLQAGAQPTSDPGERQTYSYIGLQANQLISQLFNSTPTVSNPYLMTFSINDKLKGTGFTTGFGYTYNQTREGDAFSLVDVRTSDFSLRAGLEKKMFITKRWLWSIGGDFVVRNFKEVTQGANPNTNFISEETKTFEAGFGPRCTINFVIADRIIVGTEASYYLKFGGEKHHGSASGMPSQPNRNYHTFVPALPSVIYLIMRF